MTFLYFVFFCLILAFIKSSAATKILFFSQLFCTIKYSVVPVRFALKRNYMKQPCTATYISFSIISLLLGHAFNKYSKTQIVWNFHKPKFIDYFAFLTCVNSPFQPFNNYMINGWNDFIVRCFSQIDCIPIPLSSIAVCILNQNKLSEQNSLYATVNISSKPIFLFVKLMLR